MWERIITRTFIFIIVALVWPVTSGLADPKIKLSREIQIRRVRNEGSIRLSEYVTVFAWAMVTDEKGSPESNEKVDFLVRSKAGVFKSSTVDSDTSGEAAASIRFDVPPGSLDLSIQACIADAGVCTPLVWKSLRDRFDLDITMGGGYTSSALAKPSVDSSLRSFNSVSYFTAELVPRFQYNVFEAERSWKYYRVSLYGELPLLVQNAGTAFSLGSSMSNYRSLDTTAGVGDVQVGVNLGLGGNVFADLAYNGKTGKVNTVEALRTSSAPRGVNLGDGLESFEAYLEGRKFISPTGHFAFTAVSNSLFLDRRIAGSWIVRRNGSRSVIAGIGLLESRQSAVQLWAGYRHQGALRQGPPSSMQELESAYGTFICGVSRTAMTRDGTHLGLGFGAQVKSAGSTQLGMHVIITLRPF